jgi:thiol-disulfide isomerase/thioredoxin
VPTATRPRPAERRQLPIVALVVGGIVLLAVVAVVVTALGGGSSDDAASSDVAQTRTVEVDGESLPPLSGGSDPSLGATAPSVVGSSFDGSPVSIEHDGTPKLLFFVAHWCPHCQAEVPVVVDWLDGETSKSGVSVMAVSTGVDSAAPNFPPSEWLAEEEWPAPVLADDADSSVADAYGLSAFPFFTVVDGDGTVLFRGSGELEPAQLDQLVELAAS